MIDVTDSVTVATANRIEAVRTAVALLADSGDIRTEDTIRAFYREQAYGIVMNSVMSSVRLDYRPLDPDRVHTRHLRALAALYAHDGVRVA